MILWLLVAIALDRVMLKLTAFSYNCEYTAGYASIDAVCQRRADPHAAIRVLVPWLIGLIERLFPALHKHRLPALYEPIRILAWAAALAVSERAIGTAGALAVAAFLPATFLFDFWDTPWEVLGFASALTGNLQLTILTGGLLGFARQRTALLMVPIYALTTHDWFGAGLVAIATGLAQLSVYVWVGKSDRPVQGGWEWRRNLDEVIHIFRNRPFYLSETAMSVGLTALVIWVVLMGRAGPSWPVPLAVVTANWIWPRASETRGICVTLLWVCKGLLS